EVVRLRVGRLPELSRVLLRACSRSRETSGRVAPRTLRVPRHLAFARRGEVAMKSLPSWLEHWNRFWFTPADPTPLGLLRTCCCVVVLSVHLLYTPNLYVYFGKEAWLDAQAIRELRTDYPFPGPPSGWDNQQALRNLPPIQPGSPEDLYRQKWGIDPRA